MFLSRLSAVQLAPFSCFSGSLVGCNSCYRHRQNASTSIFFTSAKCPHVKGGDGDAIVARSLRFCGSQIWISYDNGDAMIALHAAISLAAFGPASSTPG